MIFDAGVFIALDSPSKRQVVIDLIRQMSEEGVVPKTNAAALAQAWRDPSRQVPMAMAVKSTTVFPFGDPQTIGRRCAESGTSDVVDASLAVLADQLGEKILTTDATDMRRLGVEVVEL